MPCDASFYCPPSSPRFPIPPPPLPLLFRSPPTIPHQISVLVLVVHCIFYPQPPLHVGFLTFFLIMCPGTVCKLPHCFRVCIHPADFILSTRASLPADPIPSRKASYVPHLPLPLRSRTRFTPPCGRPVAIFSPVLPACVISLSIVPLTHLPYAPPPAPFLQPAIIPLRVFLRLAD